APSRERRSPTPTRPKRIPGQIFTYDIPTGTVTHISNDPDHDQQNPAISTPLIVWEDRRFGSHIGVYDRVTSATTLVGDLASTQSQPAVSSTKVVYIDNTAASVVVFDAVTRYQTTLFVGPAASPDIDGTQVVWSDHSGALSDIVVHDLSTGAETRLLFPATRKIPGSAASSAHSRIRAAESATSCCGTGRVARRLLSHR